MGRITNLVGVCALLGVVSPQDVEDIFLRFVGGDLQEVDIALDEVPVGEGGWPS